MAGENEKKSDAQDAGAPTQRVVPVSLSDFPIFDGSSSLESFLQQCTRLATLGGIDEVQLQTVIAARCRGLALNVVETDSDQGDVMSRLRAAFGGKCSELALSRLSAAVKGDTPALEYLRHAHQGAGSGRLPRVFRQHRESEEHMCSSP